MNATTEPTSTPATGIVLDPEPVAQSINEVIEEAASLRIDRIDASNRIESLLGAYADAIETVGGGVDGDRDMWHWAEKVRHAAIPDGYMDTSFEAWASTFSDALTPLWGDPRHPDEG